MAHVDADSVRYLVYACGSEVESYDTEADALADAAARHPDDYPSVVMEVRSGTYTSRTQVYPKRGETHSN